MADGTGCDVCGGELPPRCTKTCSTECRSEATRRRASAWYHANKSDPEWAARRREQTRRAGRRWAASNPDKVKANIDRWRAENAEAISEQYRQWRVDNPQRVREKNHRQRARRLDAFAAPVDRDAIWRRDSGRCGICGEPIDDTLPWPHKMSATLDHIVPLAKGGTHEPANVQLAHAVCNSRKGDR